MFRYLPIRKVYARQILDSRGNPTVEVEVTVGEGIIGLDGYTGRAMVPSGASTGSSEAVELRDGAPERFGGKGVQNAVCNVNTVLADAVVGENALNQMEIDARLREADGTERKEKLGANALLGVSLATARAAANALRIPLYQYLGGCYTPSLPVPMMNILNGGVHASNSLDMQEFMILPVGADSFSEGIRMCVETYHCLQTMLKEKNRTTAVGDEGGFAPDLTDTREALLLLKEAILRAGFAPGGQLAVAVDAAASELYDADRDGYLFPGESAKKGKEIVRSTREMIDYYELLTEEFPIVSIEDGLREDDWDGWQQFTERLGERVQLVGDDLFVTNANRLMQGIQKKAANAILIKPNQIGTVSETMEAIETARHAGWRTVISHRSGETEDSFIADLAVGTNAGQIKTGAPCRSERNAKYNQLLRIAELLGSQAAYQPPFLTMR